jgi:hypothetical protein
MKMTKRFAGILLVALVAAWVCILLTAGDSTAQLYRYTDKNGKIVFTDNPPPGVFVEPLDDEKELAPAEVTPPAQGGKPSPQPQAGREQAAPVDKDKEAEMKRVADEEIQKKQEEIQKKLQERQQDRQRRLEEADRLEKEAKQPVQPTQENIDRQMKLMQEAQRLRDMP